ncbi:MAG: apolipoprotein N-acyltransferase [Boseongicola sp.]|nr:apolipoprotein N-acyltransferase [Boseongicola sp.]
MSRGRLVLFSGLAGAAAALGHAPFGLWPVALAGFAVLIWLVSGQAGVARTGALPRTPEYFGQEETRARPGLAAWAGGVGYFAVALHWIVEPFLVDAARHGWMAPFALILMAGGLGLFWGLAGWVSARTRWPALGFAAALALVEMARGHVLTGFPWALPAYVWADTWLLGVVAYVGPYGLSALTLGLLALPMLGRPWLGGAGAAAGFLVLGVFLGTAQPVEQDRLGIVRLVQPNAPQDKKWDPEHAHVFVDRAIEFTGADARGVDLIVWPESAVPYPLDVAAPTLSRAAAAADGTEIITGINRRTDAGDWFNALIAIGGTGLVRETYDKVHLVPFGEYIPLRIDLLRAIAGFSGFGFSPGDGVRLIETPLGRALPLICYEAIFPGHGRSAARPDFLLQITNDAWFGTFSGPYQHLDQARFRAVEQGVAMIRVANTGISAVIDRDGRIVGALPLGEAGFLDVPVPAPSAAPTVYARVGDGPVAILLIVLLAGLWWLGRRNTIANRRASS